MKGLTNCLTGQKTEKRKLGCQNCSLQRTDPQTLIKERNYSYEQVINAYIL